jgi:hypothetical protein
MATTRRSVSKTAQPTSKPRARSDALAKAGKGPTKGKQPVSANASSVREDIASAARAGYRYYVYTLSDASGLFYVGKGCGQRVFAHERATATDCNPFKAARIAAAGADLHRSILAFFEDEGFAYGFESSVIAEHRYQLTNLGPGFADPIERAKAKAREMLARVVPFEMSMAKYSTFRMPERGANTAREMYDLLVSELRKEATDPSPTIITIAADGRATFGWGA